jgi:hypothetical protein
MTISTETTKISYACNSSTLIFTYTFKILDDTDLLVIVTNDTTGVETTLTLTSDYTVTGAGDDSGGTIVVGDVADVPTGSTITTMRDVPYTQETDYTEGDDFPAASHEDALDKLTMEVQQLKEMLGRTILLKKSSDYSDLTLDDPTASYYLRFKADLSGIEGVLSAPLNSTPTVVVSTMAGDTTLAFVSGMETICILDPDGSDRNYDPEAGFPSGYAITIVNTGSGIITFDSSGLGQAVGSGQKDRFYYNGTSWK